MLKNLLKKFVRDEEGQDFVEYALILVGISLIAFAAAGPLGDAIAALFDRVAGELAG
jgi:Flp pilus assembly pilin Flp